MDIQNIEGAQGFGLWASRVPGGSGDPMRDVLFEFC